MSHGRYKTRCCIERHLVHTLQVGEGYEKIVMEVVYDYGTKKARRGYKLRIFISDEEEKIADNGHAIKELYLGKYGNRFCQSGWLCARKLAGAKCSKLSDNLLWEYGLKRLPIGIGRELKKGDTFCIGNLTFLELGERQSRTDYSEKSYTLLEVDLDEEIYILQPKTVVGEKLQPPQFLRFSNDIFVSKIY